MSSVVQRKNVAKSSETSVAAESGGGSDKSSKFKERPPQFRNQKVFARIVLSSAVFIIVYFTSSKEKTTTLAGIKETLSLREHKVDCSFDTLAQDSLCLPKHCGRFASDNVISETELIKLKELSTKVFSKIFKGDDESSLAVELRSESLTEPLTKNIEEVLKALQPKLIDTISQRFETAHNSVKLSYRHSYISKTTNVTTEYSERLHQLHYDAEISKSIHYTLIIFMSSINREFNGGKFSFVDTVNGKKKNLVVEPKVGRTVGFTAGSENLYHFDKIQSGASYFISLSFTCEEAVNKV